MLRVLNLSVSLIVVLGALCVESVAAERSPRFGLDWVRSHPFTLMALTQRGEAVSENTLYAQANMTTMLAWKDRPPIFEAAARQKIPWHYHLDSRRGPLSSELQTYLSGLLAKYPGGQGMLLWDEPKLPEFADLGRISAWLKQAHPDVLVYTNLNPIPSVGDPRFAPGRAGLNPDGNESYPYSYEDSIQDCLKIIQPDVLMTDIYPFWDPESLSPELYLKQKYFLNLTMIRRAALEAGIPYWVFVQSYEDVGRCRYPSESDLRMQVYSSLAYGFTGIAYFTYDLMQEGSILDARHQPMPLYPVVTKVNKEVLHLGQSLRLLTSVDVRYVAGQTVDEGKSIANPLPIGLEAFRPKSWASTTVTDVAIEGAGANKNALLSFFEDDQGGLYFMLVNLDHGKGLDAAATTTSITVSLAPSVSSVFQLSRDTGKPQAVQLKDGRFAVKLPGGTGELYKLGDGKFAGLGK